MPVPATGLSEAPISRSLQDGNAKLPFSIEGEDGGEKWLSLGFEGVEVFKATYLTSLGSVDPELQRQAYGALFPWKKVLGWQV